MPEAVIVEDGAKPTTTADTSTSEPVKTLADEIKPVVEAPAGDKPTTATTTAEPAIPEKYQGKSIPQIIEMHENAEKLAGRQSQEVGELRSIVDDFIKGQSQSTTKPDTEEEPINIIDDPEGAVNQIVENHPAIKEAKQVVAEGKESAALSALMAKHPDANDIIGDQRFVDWVGKSQYRLSTFQNAHKNNDVNAADELFSEFKLQHPAESTETTETPETTEATVVQDRQQQLQQAQTGAVTGDGGGDGKKIFRRADLIKLKMNDPDRYEELNDEIMLAYKEKRVR